MKACHKNLIGLALYLEAAIVCVGLSPRVDAHNGHLLGWSFTWKPLLFVLACPPAWTPIMATVSFVLNPKLVEKKSSSLLPG
jgi:hypothetical protein